MTIETGINNAGVYIDALDDTYPASGDDLVEGDDHIRGIKNTLLNTFPNVTGAVTATHTQLNDAGSNANQASTAQGGTTTADGANTWAKLAEFTVDNTDGDAQASLSFLMQDVNSGQGDFIYFTCTAYSHATTGLDAASSAIVMTDNSGPNVIAYDGIKMVASATAVGSTVSIWIKKLLVGRQFNIKEIAKSGVATLTYSTGAAWTATDPTTGPPAYLVSSGVSPFASVGVDQTWQNVTADRLYGTTFTNGTGQSIMVTVRGSATLTGEPVLTVDGVSIFGPTVTSGVNSVVTAVVPPRSEYSSNMTNGTATLNRWLELRK